MPVSAPTAAGAPTAAPGWRRLAGAIPRSAWFVADQGVVSLANFAAPVLVGRFAGQQQLGYYVLGLSIYIVANALARSLVWTAYTKRLHETEKADHARLTGSATAHLVVYALAAAGVAVLVAGLVAWFGPADLAIVIAVVAGASILMLLREHVRRLCMARLDFAGVLGFDTVVAATQVGLLVALAFAGRLTAATAIMALAASASLSIGWMLLSRRAIRVEPSRLLADWRANWGTSKWLTAAATSATIGNQGYRWALPALTSLAELGRLGAGQLVVQVTNPIVIGLSNFLGPMTAKVLSDEGLKGLWRYTCRVSVLMLAGIVVFVGLVAWLGLPAIQWLLGDAAEGVTVTLLVTLAAGALSEALLVPIQAATVNRGRADLLFKTALTRLAVNITIGFGLVAAYGAEAIGVGVLLGSLVALVWQWTAFAEGVRRA